MVHVRRDCLRVLGADLMVLGVVLLLRLLLLLLWMLLLLLRRKRARRRGASARPGMTIGIHLMHGSASFQHFGQDPSYILVVEFAPIRTKELFFSPRPDPVRGRVIPSLTWLALRMVRTLFADRRTSIVR